MHPPLAFMGARIDNRVQKIRKQHEIVFKANSVSRPLLFSRILNRGPNYTVIHIHPEHIALIIHACVRQ